MSTLGETPEFASFANMVMGSKRSGNSPKSEFGVSHPNVLEDKCKFFKDNYDNCNKHVSILNQKIADLTLTQHELKQSYTILKAEIDRLTVNGSVTPDSGGMRKYKKSHKRQKSHKLKKSRKYKKSRK